RLHCRYSLCAPFCVHHSVLHSLPTRRSSDLSNQRSTYSLGFLCRGRSCRLLPKTTPHQFGSRSSPFEIVLVVMVVVMMLTFGLGSLPRACFCTQGGAAKPAELVSGRIVVSAGVACCKPFPGKVIR